MNTNYLQGVWKSRYFWFNLALAELRNKYRRSVLGMSWSIIQPMAMTALLAFVMGKILHSPILDYAPFVFSGLIIWEFLSSSATMGCSAFINSEGYIKQCTQPLVIYPLRNVLGAWFNFLVAFVGLIIWVALWKPLNFNGTQISLILAFPIIFFIGWPIAIITAFIGTIFRDFLQLITIILQALWYVSPIFFQPKVFIAGHLGFLVRYNPIYHILNLFRAPMLEGHFPSPINYIVSIATAVILWTIAWGCLKFREKHIIFYI